MKNDQEIECGQRLRGRCVQIVKIQRGEHRAEPKSCLPSRFHSKPVPTCLVDLLKWFGRQFPLGQPMVRLQNLDLLDFPWFSFDFLSDLAWVLLVLADENQRKSKENQANPGFEVEPSVGQVGIRFLTTLVSPPDMWEPILSEISIASMIFISFIISFTVQCGVVFQQIR